MRNVPVSPISDRALKCVLKQDLELGNIGTGFDPSCQLTNQYG